MGAVTDAVAAFGLTALSETGDKSQLLLIALAARWSRSPVAVGGVAGIAGVQLLAVAAGGWLAAAIEGNDRLPNYVAFAVGVGFTLAGLITFALTLRSGSVPADEHLLTTNLDQPRRSWMATALSTAGLLFVAELGDKTMFTTAALSSVRSPAAVFAGATAAFAFLATIAVVVGGAIADRLPQRTLQLGASIAFTVAGLLTIATVI